MLPFVLFKLLWRGLKQPEYHQHWQERFGIYQIGSQLPVIWLHCVSVGETRAAAPLVKLLCDQYPHYQILLTHTTPTGRATSEQLFGNTVLRAYLPYDVPFAVNGFVRHFKPRLGILLETELWFNLIRACDQANIPLCLLNARLSEKSAQGYAKLGSLVTDHLQKLTLVAAQTPEDERRFRLLGARHTSVAGNLKFDVTPPENSLALGLALRQLIGETRVILVAASTREGEEAMILDAVSSLDLLTVIVPRHPQRFDEVANLLQSRHINYVFRSELIHPIDPDIQVVVGNSMGELYTYYAACDLAFIGGSLLKFGGQNLIEAASMGKPILIGQYTYNFADATLAAVKCGAAVQVIDVAHLTTTLQSLIDHPKERQAMAIAARNFSQASTGAAVRMLQMIEQHLH